MKTDQEKHFDETIRKKLQDAEEDTSLLWEQVEQKLRNTSSRWIRGFLLSDILLALLFSGYLLAFNQEGSTFQNDNHFYPVKTHTISQSDHTKSSASNLKSNSISSSNNSSTEIKNKELSGNERILNSDINHSVIISDKKTKSSIHSNEIFSGNQLSSTENFSEKRFRKRNNKKNYSAKIQSVFPFIGNPFENNFEKFNSANRNENENIEFIIPLNNYYFSSEEYIPELKTIDPLTPFIAAEQSIFPVAFELYGILAYDKTKSNNKSPDLNAGYENGKIKNPGYGFAIRYFINPAIFASIGIQSTKNTYRLNYNFSYDHNYFTVDSIHGFIVSPFDPPVPYTVYDTSFVTETFSTIKNIEVSESKVQLPVTVGYRFTKNKWSVEGTAGIVYTISQKEKINYPLSDTEEQAKLSTYIFEFDPKQQVDGIAALSIARKISTHFECYVQSYYQQALGSATTTNSVIEIHHRSTGLKIGLRFNLSEK